MAIFYLANIGEADYERFKRLIEPCPAERHAQWLELQAREIAAIRASGHSARLVAIDSDAFARYCIAVGRRDIETLRAYVFEQATGKPY